MIFVVRIPYRQSMPLAIGPNVILIKEYPLEKKQKKWNEREE